MKKTLYTMRIDDYAPELCAITIPLIKKWARKCGAEYVEINDRRFPNWPIPYETFQIYDLMVDRNDDWAIWIDADALVHPDTPDWTCYLPRDTCAQNGTDPAPLRWQYDEYFRRDGRHISSCNWHAIVPRDCRDFFRPLDDLTLEQACDRINPVIAELRGTCQAPHLISDYTVSRNIARFGLKYTNIVNLQKLHYPDGGCPPCYNHLYTVPDEEKIDQHLLVLSNWLGGLQFCRGIIDWDDATYEAMRKRLQATRERSESVMHMKEAQTQVISWKEQAIRDGSAEVAKALISKAVTVEQALQIIDVTVKRAQVTSDEVAEIVEAFATAAIHRDP